MGKLPPNLGPRHIWSEIIHVDPILTEQREDVLRGLYEVCCFSVLQCSAERSETRLVIGRFRKTQSANEIVMFEQRRKVFGRCAEFQTALILCDVLRCGRGRRGHG